MSAIARTSVDSLRRAKAFHETAHAVTGYVQGGEVQEIYVSLPPVVNGHSRVTWPGEDSDVFATDPEQERGPLVMLLAGQMAETIAKGGKYAQPTVPAFQGALSVELCIRSTPDLARGDDVFKASSLVALLYKDDFAAAMAYIRESATTAEKLVREHWRTIERVATVALRLQTVEAAEFLRLVRSMPAWRAASDARRVRLGGG